MSSDKIRHKTRVAVYLIGLQGSKVLLGKRINTGHMDGYWSLPAGHVYEGESCTKAFIREMAEECGFNFSASELNLVGSMYHRSGEFDYINYIFKQDISNQKFVNLEPNKCEALELFDVSNLPAMIPDYVKFMLDQTVHNNNPWICEYGF